MGLLIFHHSRRQSRSAGGFATGVHSTGTELIHMPVEKRNKTSSVSSTSDILNVQLICIFNSQHPLKIFGNLYVEFVLALLKYFTHIHTISGNILKYFTSLSYS